MQKAVLLRTQFLNKPVFSRGSCTFGLSSFERNVSMIKSAQNLFSRSVTIWQS